MPDVLAVLVHGPEIHRAVAVGYEIDTIIIQHRPGAGAVKVAGKAGRLVLTVELPDLLDGTTFVTLGSATLERPAGKIQIAGLVIASVRSRCQGQWLAGHRGGVQFDQPAGRKSVVALGTIDDLSIAGKAGGAHKIIVKVIGQPFGHSAIEAHGIELGRAFVLACKDYRLAVGRNEGMLFQALVGCQPGAVVCGEVVFPEIAFGGEDYGIFIDSRGTVVAFLLGGAGLADGETQ